MMYFTNATMSVYSLSSAIKKSVNVKYLPNFYPAPPHLVVFIPSTMFTYIMRCLDFSYLVIFQMKNNEGWQYIAYQQSLVKLLGKNKIFDF